MRRLLSAACGLAERLLVLSLGIVLASLEDYDGNFDLVEILRRRGISPSDIVNEAELRRYNNVSEFRKPSFGVDGYINTCYEQRHASANIDYRIDLRHLALVKSVWLYSDCEQILLADRLIIYVGWNSRSESKDAAPMFPYLTPCAVLTSPMACNSWTEHVCLTSSTDSGNRSRQDVDRGQQLTIRCPTEYRVFILRALSWNDGSLANASDETSSWRAKISNSSTFVNRTVDDKTTVFYVCLPDSREPSLGPSIGLLGRYVLIRAELKDRENVGSNIAVCEVRVEAAFQPSPNQLPVAGPNVLQDNYTDDSDRSRCLCQRELEFNFSAKTAINGVAMTFCAGAYNYQAPAVHNVSLRVDSQYCVPLYADAGYTTSPLWISCSRSLVGRAATLVLRKDNCLSEVSFQARLEADVYGYNAVSAWGPWSCCFMPPGNTGYRSRFNKNCTARVQKCEARPHCGADERVILYEWTNWSACTDCGLSYRERWAELQWHSNSCSPLSHMVRDSQQCRSTACVANWMASPLTWHIGLGLGMLFTAIFVVLVLERSCQVQKRKHRSGSADGRGGGELWVVAAEPSLMYGSRTASSKRATAAWASQRSRRVTSSGGGSRAASGGRRTAATSSTSDGSSWRGSRTPHAAAAKSNASVRSQPASRPATAASGRRSGGGAAPNRAKVAAVEASSGPRGLASRPQRRRTAGSAESVLMCVDGVPCGTYASALSSGRYPDAPCYVRMPGAPLSAATAERKK